LDLPDADADNRAVREVYRAPFRLVPMLSWLPRSL
jgi:hypothetical protein